MKTPIQTKDAPAAIGTYSQAIRAGDTIYLSGQIPLDPQRMELVQGIEAQIHQVFKNLAAVAKAAGLGLDRAVRMTVYLTDARYGGDFAKVRKEVFPANAPSSSQITVSALAVPGFMVEVHAIAVVGDEK